MRPVQKQPNRRSFSASKMNASDARTEISEHNNEFKSLESSKVVKKKIPSNEEKLFCIVLNNCPFGNPVAELFFTCDDERFGSFAKHLDSRNH
jgi:hypothetical protein